MEKRTNKYHLTLTQTALANGNPVNPSPLQIEFENHDEVLGIIEILKQKDPFQNTNQAIEFAIGLKMFSEVMIKNKENPLFSELLPVFGTFMKKLKAL